MRLRHVGLSVLAVTACWAATPATHAQTTPACQSNAGANIDRPKLVAWGRSGIVKVFAETPEAQATGTFSVSSKDPAHPISHPASMPYAQLGEQEGNRQYRFRAEKGDGDALVALTWTKVENNTTCTARVSQTITVNKGKRPFISIVHERSPKIIFGHERPDCTETQVVSWKMVVTGPGGTVRESIADVCGESKFFHRRGSNAHFRVTARSGVMVFTAQRPHGEYKASYRVTIGGKLAVKGGLRALVRRGKVIVVISIKRP